ncbi:MAG TPA: CoA transferase [Porticoccaceae bacterium]|nr:CoA transferase [Porticoccaceae bacterium]
MTPKHVLDGYRVLDITQYLAGPAATNLMVQMGAEVIKLEIGPHGEPVRNFPYCRDGRSGYFIQQNRGKKSLCLDPKHPEGLDIVKRLLRHCDVFIENFAPGVIGRLGLDWEVVRKINPNIVMCSISAFGQEGPLAAHPGFDYIAQAYAAVTDLIGEPDRAPSMPMLAFGDVGTGVHALTAIGYALLDRERNGAGGQWLDISLLDTYFHHHEVSVQAYSASGGKIVPHRSGAHHYAVGPSGIFKAREGHLMILALLHQWPILCRAMGREELIADPQFVDNDARMVNRTEMIAIIEAWLQTLPSDAAALELLEKARIPCAPILSVPQAMAHPHLIERRTVREIEDRLLGKFKIPGMPLRFSKYEVDEDIQAPLLGEHNEEILKQLLLCPPEQVRDWERRKVLFAKSV